MCEIAEGAGSDVAEECYPWRKGKGWRRVGVWEKRNEGNAGEERTGKNGGGAEEAKIMVQCRWKDAGRVYYEAPREAGHGLEVKSHDIELDEARGEAERRREEGVDA